MKIFTEKEFHSLPKEQKTGCIIYPNGDKEWFKNGKLHRDDGPAIEYATGSKHWYKEGNLHRDDGPAIEYIGGSKRWYKEDKLHREDGPAIENFNGTKGYFLNNIKYSYQEWFAISNNLEKFI